MNTEILERHFDSIGARVTFRPMIRRDTPSGASPPPFLIDVVKRGKEEVFEFAVRGEDLPEKLSLLQKLPQEQHLLLFHEGNRYLCGHDERSWFVAAVDAPVSTVRDAKKALIPKAILGRIKSLPPSEYTRRKNVVFQRQGEWFFVPVTRRIPEDRVLKKEPIMRDRRSKPHICEELYREGGEIRYLAGRTKVMTEEEYHEVMKTRPESLRNRSITQRVANPDMYVRGTVKHPDHKTITLKGWHRAFINAEYTADTVVAFLD